MKADNETTGYQLCTLLEEKGHPLSLPMNGCLEAVYIVNCYDMSIRLKVKA